MRSIESRIAAVRRRTRQPEEPVQRESEESMRAGMDAWLRVLEEPAREKIPFWRHPNARDL